VNDQETEVKFYVRDLRKIEMRLPGLKAHLIQSRMHEINYRYDFPDGSLRTNGQVLRLRKTSEACLTFKGPSSLVDGIFSRQELEFTVGDFGTAQRFLEALGYVRILIYEKYRSIFDFNGCHLMLDELPYGDFVEIEGADTTRIRQSTAKLGLDFEAAVGAGYGIIFENYKSKHGIAVSDLTFDAFRGDKPSAEDLDVRAAD